jgi:hypothetical protein
MELTPDGWAVRPRYWRYFLFVVDHEPPRPGALWAQLQVDSVSWKPIAFLLAGVGLVAAGAGTRQVGVLAIGLAVLGLYVGMWVSAARRLGDWPAVVGLVAGPYSHPTTPYVATAPPLQPGGRGILLRLPAAAVADAVDKDGRIEILFLWNTRTKVALFLAARAGVRPAQAGQRLPPGLVGPQLPPAPDMKTDAPDVPWEDDARRVLGAVEWEAGGDGYFGTRHLLLAAARHAPTAAGLDYTALRAVAGVEPGPPPPAGRGDGRWPTPALRLAIARAAMRGLAGGRSVRAHDVWHALLADSDSECRHLLYVMGMNPDDLLRKVAAGERVHLGH